MVLILFMWFGVCVSHIFTLAMNVDERVETASFVRFSNAIVSPEQWWERRKIKCGHYFFGVTH